MSRPGTICEIIVVGTSFGGFDALKAVLGVLPRAFSVPIAIVQHQGSTGVGLAGLLQRYTALDVVDAEDKEKVRPGSAYLAPPGYHLLVERGSLALSVDPPVMHARPSIDVLFESAADAYGPNVVGVILTGTGCDGAAGVAHIKSRGGLTIVQDPRTAARAAMPEAAIARTAVDLILSLDEIGPCLIAVQEALPIPTLHPRPAPESPLARI